MTWQNTIKTFTVAMVERIIEKVNNEITTQNGESLSTEEKKELIVFLAKKFIGAMKNIHSSSENVLNVRAYLIWCIHRLLSDADSMETKEPDLPLRNPKDSLARIMFGGDYGYAVKLSPDDHLELLDLIKSTPNPKRIAYQMIENTFVSLINRGFLNESHKEEI